MIINLQKQLSSRLWCERKEAYKPAEGNFILFPVNFTLDFIKG